ncbi:MAG: aldo/keto reductase [Gemmatimonadales bacterium]
MDRRDFLHLSAAATLAGLPRPGGQDTAMLATAPIPSTGERIPRIGLGTWQTFDVAPGAANAAARRRDLTETLRVFVESGATVIDSSPMYGASEQVVGDLLTAANARGRCFLATKVWTSGERRGVEQMEASIGKLRAGRLDLMQIHNLVDWRTHLKTLRAWKDAGRIRYLGITHYQASAISDVAAIVRAERLDFVQLNLSLEEPQAATDFLQLCADRGVAFIANRPFGGGGAFGRVRGKALPPWAGEYGIDGWAQFFLKWVLSHPQVTCAIPGTGNPRHLTDNLGAARGRQLDAEGRAGAQRFWLAL